jgi:hypothetical protein
VLEAPAPPAPIGSGLTVRPPHGGAAADSATAFRAQVSRQIAHWRAATLTLDDPSNFASEHAWRSLESYLDTSLRRELQAAVDRLKREVTGLHTRLGIARSLPELHRLREDVVAFRSRFEKVETVLDFYGDAVNTRTSPKLSALLRACDILATASMQQVLPPLGRSVPPVLTYIDKGLGASILRAGLRLWDPNSLSPAAAVKITRHNLYRPTSLIHETGHQVAFSLHWNEELSSMLGREIGRHDAAAGETWAGWSSEIAADAFAFATTGYAAVAALHDVVAGANDAVFRLPLSDPHPVAYLRVLVNVEMCRHSFGAGPWDDLAAAWLHAHPISRAPGTVQDLLQRCLPHNRTVADVCLGTPMRAFGGRSLARAVDVTRVSPQALAQLATRAGPALFSSPHWLRTENLRLLALSGYRSATQPEHASEIAEEFERWMLHLGGAHLIPAGPAAPQDRRQLT